MLVAQQANWKQRSAATLHRQPGRPRGMFSSFWLILPAEASQSKVTRTHGPQSPRLSRYSRAPAFPSQESNGHMQQAHTASSTGVVPLSCRASGQHKENGKDILKSQGFEAKEKRLASRGRTALVPSVFPVPWKKSPSTLTQRRGESRSGRTSCGPGGCSSPCSRFANTKRGANHGKTAR